MAGRKQQVQSNDPALTEMLTRLIKTFQPELIYLFGSKARDDAGPDSDYDLMIITKYFHDHKQVRLFKSMIRKKLAHNHIPADIIIQSKEEVESKKKITGHIVRQVLKEGILL